MSSSRWFDFYSAVYGDFGLSGIPLRRYIAVMSDAVAVARALDALHNGVCIPDYEKLLSQAYHRVLFRMEPHERIVLDVGAHSGLHLEQFARLASDAGRVIAFEPIPDFAGALAQRFPQPNVEVRQIALGRERAMASFCYFPNATGMSGLRMRDSVALAEVRSIAVQVDTLDRQAAGLERLSYIKIDIEGGEIDCLKGAGQTLAQLRPFVSVEYGKPSYTAYGHDALALFTLARDIGYVLSDLFGNLIKTEPEWLAICDLSYWDYFLVPDERVGDWRSYF
jgi:FkbM family methyltransferase